jgi:hypothetical protein
MFKHCNCLGILFGQYGVDFDRVVPHTRIPIQNVGIKHNHVWSCNLEDARSKLLVTSPFSCLLPLSNHPTCLFPIFLSSSSD